LKGEDSHVKYATYSALVHELTGSRKSIWSELRRWSSRRRATELDVTQNLETSEMGDVTALTETLRDLIESSWLSQGSAACGENIGVYPFTEDAVDTVGSPTYKDPSTVSSADGGNRSTLTVPQDVTSEAGILYGPPTSPPPEGDLPALPPFTQRLRHLPRRNRQPRDVGSS
jgi:hypothetical protein